MKGLSFISMLLCLVFYKPPPPEVEDVPELGDTDNKEVNGQPKDEDHVQSLKHYTKNHENIKHSVNNMMQNECITSYDNFGFESSYNECTSL